MTLENLKNILIIDLEATCWENEVDGLERRQTVDDMEIIEFGCVIATSQGEIIDTKSFLVRPVKHPVLTEFCKNLTTITQADVENASTYEEVVKEINKWLLEFRVDIWASWGNYDLDQIQAEFRRHSVAPEFIKLSHVNLRKLWKKIDAPKKVRTGGIKTALSFLGLGFTGTPHRGIDDAINIAKVLPFLNIETI